MFSYDLLRNSKQSLEHSLLVDLGSFEYRGSPRFFKNTFLYLAKEGSVDLKVEHRQAKDAYVEEVILKVVTQFASYGILILLRNVCDVAVHLDFNSA